MKRKILLLQLLLFILTGCEKMFQAQPDDTPVAIFENLWTTFNEEYAPFEERKIDWNAEYSEFRPLINENTTDAELYEVITQMLATLDDGHINLTVPGKEIFFANKIKRDKTDNDLFNISLIRDNYLDPGYYSDEDENYVYGKIKNRNIGYIFFDNVGDNFFKLNEFLTKYESAEGVIIDLRHNQGGDFTYCFSEIGRLTDTKRYVFRSKTRNGKGKNDYTEWKEWHIEPNGSYLNKPLVVLTDRYTISAGERSVMAFQTLPNVTVIGDTTNGAHGTMIGRELANGWFYSVVPQKVELPDGKSYEGIGLAPDIYIKNHLSEISAGIDMTLQTAIEHLR